MRRQDKYTEDIIVALNDIEAVKNDPQYSEADKLAFQLVTDFRSKGSVNRLNESFIRDNLRDSGTTDSSDIKPFTKYGLYKYMALAAAVIGAVFFVRSLLPSADPDRLFNKFYEPLNLVSDVTRGPADAQDGLTLEAAIMNYKKGEYEKAVEGFAKTGMNDGLEGDIVFYQGIANLAARNYSEASSLLSKAVSYNANFNIEARWYLALTYLKTGDIIKAEECFKELALTPGYYKEPSDRILRRLK